MNDIARIAHPLVRSGKSQRERYLDTLRTDYVHVDERNLADLLVFIGDFSRQVRYYDMTNRPQGDWQAFFQFSLPIHIARISKYDPELKLQAFLKAVDASRASANTSIQTLKPVVAEGVESVKLIQSWVNGFGNGSQHELKRTIQNLVKTNFIEALTQWIGLAKALSVRLGLSFDIDYSFIWSPLWSTNPGSSPLLSALPDAEIMAFRGSNEAILLIALGKLEDLYLRLFQGIKEIINEAPAYLEDSLLNTGKQSPHIAILLAFIRLHRELQGDLNTMTRRHLDFFYRDVLRFEEIPASPDRVNLVLEMAKQLDQYRFEQGLLFKGGKDENKQEILFQLTEELVASKAKIGKLQSQFVDFEEVVLGDNGGKVRLINGVYSAPIANSADGQGESLDAIDPPIWSTLGSKESRLETPESTIDNPVFQPMKKPRVGFAIATKDLWLQAGVRRIALTVSCTIKNSFQTVLNGLQIPETIHLTKDLFDLYVTTEDGWVAIPEESFLETDVDNNTVSETKLLDASASLVINATIEIPIDFPAIIGATAKTLEEDFGTELPMLRIDLKHQEEYFLTRESNSSISISYLQLIQQSTIENVEFDINVSEITVFEIKTKTGTADPETPVLPFGNTPKVGDGFTFKYDEMFEKLWSNFSLDFDWETDPDKIGDGSSSEHIYYYYQIEPVNKNSFKFKIELSDGSLSQERGLFGPNFNLDNTANKPGNKSSKPISCYLNSATFLVDKYPLAVGNQTLAVSQLPDRRNYPVPEAIYFDGTTKILGEIIDDDVFRDMDTHGMFSTGLARPPYIPVMLNLKLTYGVSFPGIETASSSENTYNSLQLIQLNPLGGGKAINLVDEEGKAKSLEEIAADSAEPISQTSGAVPSVFQDFSDEGCLFIGLENLQPGSNLNLYFQLAESTANAELEKAEINWQYLTLEGWKSLEPDIHVLEDGTLGLIQTGIVKLAIPRDISDENLQMEPGYHWIKIVATKNSAAIAKALAIETNAVEAVFLEHARLHLGFKDFVAGEIVEINAQITAPKIGAAETIRWHFLKRDQWIPILTDNLIEEDDTKGFHKSGTIKFRLPKEATLNNTLFPLKHIWLRADIEGRSGVQILAFTPNNRAAAISLAELPNDMTRLDSPLEAGSVKKTFVENIGLKKANQPYPSFGGKIKENGDEFYLRVSEHLKHKGRGINAFDYERILLQEFPEIHKVKCLTHTMGRKAAFRNLDDPEERDFHWAPGFVTLAVIPDLSKLTHDGRQEPRFMPNRLEAFHQFIAKKISPFVRLQILNPLYEKVNTNFRVAFYPGKSNAFYIRQLKEDINRFLAPWAFDEGEDIAFGGTIFKSSILNFVEELPYVDVVKDFIMLDQDNNIMDEIVARESRSILTSGKHEPFAFNKEQANDSKSNATRANMKGLGYWKLEEYEVAPPPPSESCEDDNQRNTPEDNNEDQE